MTAWDGSAPAMRARPLHAHDAADDVAGCLERLDGIPGYVYRCTSPGVYPAGVVLVVEAGKRPQAVEISRLRNAR